MNLKSHLQPVIFGLAGGAAVIFIFLSSGGLNWYIRRNIASILIPAESSSPIPSPAPYESSTPIPDLYQRMVAQTNLTAVAIQTFSGPKLIRSGTGTIVSSDGLILTTADVVPFGRYVIQTTVNDKILRASVSARDVAQNLAILRVDASGLTVANFETTSGNNSGRELLLTGKTVSLSTATPFSQRALLSYPYGKLFVLDTISNTFISGARALVANGSVAGIVFLRSQKVYLIPASITDAFIKSYLADQTQ